MYCDFYDKRKCVLSANIFKSELFSICKKIYIFNIKKTTYPQNYLTHLFEV